MFINITDSKEAANKGSSAGLVHYLEKENRLDHKQQPEYWFNGQQVRIEPYEVKANIDSNIAKLGRDDAKFFLVNISPSQKEIAFLKEQYGEDGAKEQMKGFAVRVMDAYAQNFNRDGVNSHEDSYGSPSWKTTVIMAIKTRRSNRDLKSAATARTASRCMCRSLSAVRMRLTRSSLAR